MAGANARFQHANARTGRADDPAARPVATRRWCCSRTAHRSRCRCFSETVPTKTRPMGDIERVFFWAGRGARRRHRTRILAPDSASRKWGTGGVQLKNTRPGRKRGFRDGCEVRFGVGSSARSSERQRAIVPPDWPVAIWPRNGRGNENRPDGWVLSSGLSQGRSKCGVLSGTSRPDLRWR